MGGLSFGVVEKTNDAIVFSGSISTENNGGFTSTFTPISAPMPSAKNMVVKFMGDGKVYQLRVRNQVMGYELAYKIEVNTQPNVIEIRTFKLADFKANFRGRIIDNAPVLQADTISHVGFLLRSNQSGCFSFSIHSIRFE